MALVNSVGLLEREGEDYAAIERDSEKTRNPLSQEQKRRQTLFHVKEKC